MESHKAENNNIRSKKQIKKNSTAYLRQREKANARKRKFLDKMTEEEKEIKRAKGREYYYKKKTRKEREEREEHS